ncbi:hypothetical protein Pst134EB_008061 [Puccinia striiformis f. sp. tritici]|nr:hypothetical protein Pst134EB_008061 [Puccinia striiformis f. sp. tritici]
MAIRSADLKLNSKSSTCILGEENPIEVGPGIGPVRNIRLRMQHHIPPSDGLALRPTHLDLQTENAHALCADQKPSILGQITNLSQQHADHEIFQPCAPSSPPNSGIEGKDVYLPLAGLQAVYPLDDSLQAHELKFFQTSTGIQDTTDLKKHILEIREKAYQRFPYPCIWGFEFLKGKTLTHPFYQEMKETKFADPNQKYFIDLGTFVGVDLRQVVEDGWNPSHVLGIDVHQEWRDLGHQLFKDGGDKALPFYLGDILKPKTLDDVKASDQQDTQPVLDLRNLKDLNQLKGRVSFIAANQLFHLFTENDQRELAERCGRLLSHEPGAAIFGTQLGVPQEKDTYLLHLHSPESWERMWKEVLGEKIKVTVKLEMADAGHPYHSLAGVEDLYWLYWSVVRI